LVLQTFFKLFCLWNIISIEIFISVAWGKGMGILLIGTLLYTCSIIIVVDLVDNSTKAPDTFYEEKSIYDD
tara:strand:- start:2463 stop:2675 length:213 start_codon:yes stop_codon:yes gene_type:complete